MNRFSEWTIGTHAEMWNSGVLAARTHDRPLFERALALYDTMGQAGIQHFARGARWQDISWSPSPAAV